MTISAVDGLPTKGHARHMLITGAAGFLGSAVVRTAAAQQRTVVAVVRPGSDPSRLPLFRGTSVEVDLTDTTAVAAMVGRIPTDAGLDVVHCASNSGHATPDQHVSAWQTNLMGTVNLLAALRGHGDLRFVQVGAGTEYGPSNEPLVEEFTGLPITVRGASKLAATTAVRQWAREFSHRVAVVRPFSIYGPGEPCTRLTSTLLRCALDNTPFTRLDGTSRRDLVYVDDVAAGVVRALDVTGPDGPVLNLGTGIEHDIDEVLAAVEQATKTPIAIADERRPVQPHDVEHWVADTRRSEALLGWAPPTTLAAGLAVMWAQLQGVRA